MPLLVDVKLQFFLGLYSFKDRESISLLPLYLLYLDLIQLHDQCLQMYIYILISYLSSSVLFLFFFPLPPFFFSSNSSLSHYSFPHCYRNLYIDFVCMFLYLNIWPHSEAIFYLHSLQLNSWL